MSRILILLIYLSLVSCDRSESDDAYLAQASNAVLNGKWIVINYWATWCGPCREEIPELNRLSREQPESLKVFGVNFEPVSGDEMEKNIKEMGILFPVFPEDPYEQLGYERPLVLPTTIVISPDGSIHAELIGPQTRDSIIALTNLN